MCTEILSVVSGVVVVVVSKYAYQVLKPQLVSVFE